MGSGDRLAQLEQDQRRRNWEAGATETWEGMEVCGTVVEAETRRRSEELLNSTCPRCSRGESVPGQRTSQRWKTLAPDLEVRGPQNAAW